MKNECEHGNVRFYCVECLEKKYTANIESTVEIKSKEIQRLQYKYDEVRKWADEKVDVLKSQLAKQQSLLARAVEVLTFYADDLNYWRKGNIEPVISEDMGYTARSFLAEMKVSDE